MRLSAFCKRLIALKEKEDSERELKERQEKFVAGIAHDLRTPLTGLVGYLEICKKQERASTEYEHYVDKCLIKATQITELFDKLMECFISETQIKCTLDTCSKIEVALGDYLSEMSVLLKQKGFEICIDDLKWRDVTVCVNTDYMWRIICNIESNIEKYGDIKRKVILSTKYGEKEVDLIIINGKENGCTNLKGTRIGLQNIRGMMEQMGGAMEKEENQDTFALVLRFPLGHPGTGLGVQKMNPLGTVGTLATGKYHEF